LKGLWTYLIEDTLETTEFQNIDLMMIDSVYVSKEYRTKMAEILFEELKVNSVIFMNASTLTLFSSGETTGFVIESGHGITTVCPIYEGYP
jgi:centractin